MSDNTQQFHNGPITEVYGKLSRSDLRHLYVQVALAHDGVVDSKIEGFLDPSGFIRRSPVQVMVAKSYENHETYCEVSDDMDSAIALYDDRELKPTDGPVHANYAVVGVNLYEVTGFNPSRDDNGGTVRLIDTTTHLSCSVPLEAVRLWLDTANGGFVSVTESEFRDNTEVALSRSVEDPDNPNEVVSARVRDNDTTTLRIYKAEHTLGLDFDSSSVLDWCTDVAGQIKAQRREKDVEED